MNNPAGKLTFWIMGSLFALLMLMASGVAAAFNARLGDIEARQQLKSERMIELEAEVKGLRMDVCRMEGKIDDLIEDMTHRRQYRTPCP